MKFNFKRKGKYWYRTDRHDKPHIVSKCRNCEKYFMARVEIISKNLIQKFCSTKCTASYYGRKNRKGIWKRRICRTCGIQYVYKGKNHDGKYYCSRKCAFKQWKIIHPQRWEHKPYLKCIVYFYKCKQCNKLFTAKNKNTKFCCKECQYKYSYNQQVSKIKILRLCRYCKGAFFFKYKRMSNFCSEECRLKQQRLQRKISKKKRRAIKRNYHIADNINPIEIFERDNWVCHICNRKIDKNKKYPNPYCATIDHIIPISKGGNHKFYNVKTAHLKCNHKKSDKILKKKHIKEFEIHKNKDYWIDLIENYKNKHF